MLVYHLLKTKKEFKNLKKQETQAIFTKMNLISLVLARRIASDKVLKDKAFNISKNPIYDGYARGLASMVYKFLDKLSKSSGAHIPLEINEQLANELHTPIIRNF